MNLKNISTDQLDFSRRTTNALKSAGILNLEQIIERSFSPRGFLGIKNLGKKSINEIERVIKEIDIEKIQSIKIIEERKHLIVFDNIKECLDYVFNQKFKKNKDILKKRIFDGYTLDECGIELGVTRERIRQIEAKFFRILSSKLSDNYIQELNLYFKENVGIDGVYEFEKVGPAYKKISSYLLNASNPKVFLKFFFKSKKLLNWQKKRNEFYFYPFKSMSLDELINDEKLLDFIESSPSSNIKESIRVYCMIHNQDNNFDYIYEEIKQKIAGKGPGHACLFALTQLKKDYTFITLNQVLKFIKENFDKDFYSSKRTIDNILSSTYTKKFGSRVRKTNLYQSKGAGNYFFLDKLGVDNKVQEEIVNFILKLIHKRPEKNFNTQEFLDFFIETQKFSNTILDKIDRYIIDAILLNVSEEYDILNYLGRSMWSGNSNAKQKRIEIYPSVLKILKDNNAPMKIKDIKKELKKVRGGVKNIQFHTTLSTPKLMQVSSGLWGLRDRDINVSKEQELKILKFMQDEFQMVTRF